MKNMPPIVAEIEQLRNRVLDMGSSSRRPSGTAYARSGKETSSR